MKKSLAQIYAELDAALNMLDNIGFLPADTENAQNTAARYEIFRMVADEVLNRAGGALRDLEQHVKEVRS